MYAIRSYYDNLEPVQDQWDEKVKKLHIENREKTIKGLAAEFGEWQLEIKVKNFKDLQLKPFSVAAFHNKFLDLV